MRSGSNGSEERRQRLEDEGNIPAESTDVLAGYVRVTEPFQQQASVGMY
jgi:hypothetical protein